MTVKQAMQKAVTERNYALAARIADKMRFKLALAAYEAAQ